MLNLHVTEMNQHMQEVTQNVRKKVEQHFVPEQVCKPQTRPYLHETGEITATHKLIIRVIPSGWLDINFKE